MSLEPANQLQKERWKSAYAWFERAMELPVGERLAFSQQAIRDPEVLQLVLDLLESQKSEEAAPPEGAPRPHPGEHYGRFAIGELLGRGGMGEVYSARDTELNRGVAIKFLSPQSLGSSGTVERLIQEARAASALNHPGIVTVHEVIRSEDSLAIVMERVDGIALRNLCGKPNQAAEVARLGSQIAEALAAAHAAGVVHRDIKPENLMVRPDGYLKVLDFGAAAQIGEDDDLVGIPIGTLGYMSPEQIQGKPLTGASDVFSLGVVLNELASGRHPFLRDTAALTSQAIQTSEPGWPTADECKIAEPLGSLLRSMLAKEPDRRPSAVMVAARLAATVREPASNAWRRLAVPALLVASVCLAAAVWLLWPIASNLFAPKEPLFEQITMQSSENRVTAAALSPNGEELAFGALGGPAYVRRMSDGFTRPLRTPGGLQIDRLAWFADSSRLVASGTIDHRAGVWVMPLNGGAPSLIGPEGKDAVPSPDGTRIALTSADGATIGVIGVNGGRLRQIRDGRGSCWFSALLWSPDGKRISYERQDYAPPKNPGLAPAQLSRDYAYAYEATDVNTGRVVTSLKDILMTSACGLKDGRVQFLRWMLRKQGGDVRQLCEMRTNPKTGEVLGPPHPVTQSADSGMFLGMSSISAAYDGSKTAVVRSSEQQNPNIYIADLPPAGEVSKLLNIRKLTFMLADDYPHAWTPDNEAVIFESNRNGHYGLFRQKIDGQEPEPLVLSSDGDNVVPIASPGGKWVLYREDREKGTKRRVMRVPMNGGTPQPLPGTENVVDFRCAQQPGSRCVLRFTEKDQFVFYELDPQGGRGRELARAAWSPTGLLDWDISPDGRFAAMPNHDPRTAIVRVVSLDRTRADAAERVVTLNGMKNLNGLIWAANGEGWYAVEITPLGLVMFYVDVAGAHSWELLRSSLVLWAVPSPDGRKLAFPQDTPWSNVYLVKRLR
ncbi:MAG TPA: protein kinase [Bryobacteraceae bacterium]|nr:protein kinase [Bryobacteraceae bacterium]